MGRLVERASINIVPFDEVHAVDAAELFLKTKDNGLSFADRACLSLGIELGAPLYPAKRIGELLPWNITLCRNAANA